MLASLIYYSVFNFPIWGFSPRLVTGKPPLNRNLIHYIQLRRPAHNIQGLTIRGVIDTTTISSCHYPSNLSVIVWGLFGVIVTLDTKKKKNNNPPFRNVSMFAWHTQKPIHWIMQGGYSAEAKPCLHCGHFSQGAFVFMTKVSKLQLASTQGTITFGLLLDRNGPSCLISGLL